jgi:hypothetical protein
MKQLVSPILQAITALALIALIALQLAARGQAAQHAEALHALLLEPRYEYKVLTVAADVHDRTGSDALKPAGITLDDRELSKLGGQGWDVVASFLELETAYPNFGDAKYVTGLQPNVRPQRVVLVLRHRIG